MDILNVWTKFVGSSWDISVRTKIRDKHQHPSSHTAAVAMGWREKQKGKKGAARRVKKKEWQIEICADPPATLRDKLHWWAIFPTLALIHYSSLQDNNKWMAAVGNLCPTKSVNMAPTIQWPIRPSIAMHCAKIHHNELHFTQSNPHRQSLTATEKWISRNGRVMRQIFLKCKYYINLLIYVTSSGLLWLLLEFRYPPLSTSSLCYGGFLTDYSSSLWFYYYSFSIKCQSRKIITVQSFC